MDAMELAAQHGNSDLIEAVMEWGGNTEWRDACARKAVLGAARAGNRELVQRFMASQQTASANDQNVSGLDHLESRPIPPSALMEALAGVVRNDYRDAFEHLREQYPDWTNHIGNAYTDAIRHGRAAYEDEMAPHANLDCVVRALTAAAETGNTAAINRLLLRHHDVINAPMIAQVLSTIVKSMHWIAPTQLADRFVP